MEKRTREIIALVLLIVLGIAVAVAMAWYILVGHNWNQAATHIDDLVGSMDGYTVVVYDGVVKRPKDEKNADALMHDAKLRDDKSGPGSDKLSENSSGGKQALNASSVANSYREKGAAVIVIGKKGMDEFVQPSIVKRNGERYGLFAFAGSYRYRFPEFRSYVRNMQLHSVDFVIGLAKDKSLLKHRLNGINLLVMMRDANLPDGGEYRGSTLCVDSPYRGEVQAVIISPSGVMTSRTVREL